MNLCPIPIALCSNKNMFKSVVLEKRIFYFVNVFLLFRNYLPLEKGMALHLNNHEFPLPNDALCQVWLKLALWFWRRWKCGKFSTTTTTTDKFRSGKLTFAHAGWNGIAYPRTYDPLATSISTVHVWQLTDNLLTVNGQIIRTNDS